jgi:hypothetical protein
VAGALRAAAASARRTGRGAASLARAAARAGNAALAPLDFAARHYRVLVAAYLLYCGACRFAPAAVAQLHARAREAAAPALVAADRAAVAAAAARASALVVLTRARALHKEAARRAGLAWRAVTVGAAEGAGTVGARVRRLSVGIAHAAGFRSGGDASEVPSHEQHEPQQERQQRRVLRQRAQRRFTFADFSVREDYEGEHSFDVANAPSTHVVDTPAEAAISTAQAQPAAAAVEPKAPAATAAAPVAAPAATELVAASPEPGTVRGSELASASVADGTVTVLAGAPPAAFSDLPQPAQAVAQPAAAVPPTATHQLSPYAARARMLAAGQRLLTAADSSITTAAAAAAPPAPAEPSRPQHQQGARVYRTAFARGTPSLTQPLAPAPASALAPAPAPAPVTPARPALALALDGARGHGHGLALALSPIGELGSEAGSTGAAAAAAIAADAAETDAGVVASAIAAALRECESEAEAETEAETVIAVEENGGGVVSDARTGAPVFARPSAFEDELFLEVPDSPAHAGDAAAVAAAGASAGGSSKRRISLAFVDCRRRTKSAMWRKSTMPLLSPLAEDEVAHAAGGGETDPVVAAEC